MQKSQEACIKLDFKKIITKEMLLYFRLCCRFIYMASLNVIQAKKYIYILKVKIKNIDLCRDA